MSPARWLAYIMRPCQVPTNSTTYYQSVPPHADPVKQQQQQQQQQQQKQKQQKQQQQ